MDIPTGLKKKLNCKGEKSTQQFCFNIKHLKNDYFPNQGKIRLLVTSQKNIGKVLKSQGI